MTLHASKLIKKDFGYFEDNIETSLEVDKRSGEPVISFQQF